MQDDESSVTLAAKLYEVRSTVRTILGDRFKAKMLEFGNAIKLVSREKTIDLLQAALLLAKAAEDEGSSLTAMMFMAAAVEATDPS